jgi:chromosome segregation ATPase
MKSPAGTLLLLLCVVLAGALIWNGQQEGDRQKADELRIGNYSNKWVETSAALEQQRQIDTALEADLKLQRDNFSTLSNAHARATVALEQAAASLQSARESVAGRDARIAELESRNQVLDQRLLDLGMALSTLTAQINDLKMSNRTAALPGVTAASYGTNPPPPVK